MSKHAHCVAVTVQRVLEEPGLLAKALLVHSFTAGVQARGEQ